MKKVIFTIFLCLILIFGLTGCSLFKNSKKDNKNNSNDNNQVIENNKGDDNMTSNGKELVLYFSQTGTTEKVANKIASIIGADIIEIVPKEKYTEADLNYNNDNSRANREQNDKSSRPEIANHIDIEDYDTIYLGYPIWWGTSSKIILTLLDKYNFDGKNVVLFCTSGSTGIEVSINDIKQYNSNINVIGGKRFSSNESVDEIKMWINSLNISSNTDIKNIYVKVNNHTLTIDLEDNSSSKALVEKLKQNDITINMEDYANFEKVGDLGFNLPTNDTQITVNYGDVILYQGNKITIYYDTNSWSFTKLGHINISQSELKNILGSGSVKITLSLND